MLILEQRESIFQLFITYNMVHIVGGDEGWQALISIIIYNPVSKRQVLSPIKLNKQENVTKSSLTRGSCSCLVELVNMVY